MSQTRKLAALVVSLVFAGLCAWFGIDAGLLHEKASPELERAQVVRVVDGDTLIVKTDKDPKLKVRLIGVDTPESVHPQAWKNTEQGKVASHYTKSLLPAGTTVYLERDIKDQDKYGRALRYVWLSPDTKSPDNMLNKKLLDEGYAVPRPDKEDTKYSWLLS